MGVWRGLTSQKPVAAAEVTGGFSRSDVCNTTLSLAVFLFDTQTGASAGTASQPPPPPCWGLNPQGPVKTLTTGTARHLPN